MTTVTTTIAAVQKIIEYDTDLIPDLQPFIDSAITLVTAVVAVDPAPSDAILELVARYLTAHLVRITDKDVLSEQVKSLQESYALKLGLGLATSHFGQMAMMFDTSGRLARWNARNVAGTGTVQFFWAGTQVL